MADLARLSFKKETLFVILTADEVLAIPNGRAIPNNLPFMINTYNMAFFHL